VQALVGHGYSDVDFAALLEQEAKAAGLELVAEDAAVSDGLSSANGGPTAGAQPAARTVA
jgi:hypothetical protein